MCGHLSSTVMGPPFNPQGGDWRVFLINNFWCTLREIYNLPQEMFYINI